MSIRTAAYVRVLLDPRDEGGKPVDPSPSIAALSPNARHLAELLSNVADANGEWSPSIETLARRMGRGARFVQRARAELVAAGVLTVDVGGGRGRASTYRFPVVNPLSTTVSGETPFAPETVSGQTRNGVSPDTRRDHEGDVLTERDATSRAPTPPQWIREGITYGEWVRRERAAGNIPRHNAVRPA